MFSRQFCTPHSVPKISHAFQCTYWHKWSGSTPAKCCAGLFRFKSLRDGFSIVSAFRTADLLYLFQLRFMYPIRVHCDALSHCRRLKPSSWGLVMQCARGRITSSSQRLQWSLISFSTQRIAWKTWLFRSSHRSSTLWTPIWKMRRLRFARCLTLIIPFQSDFVVSPHRFGSITLLALHRRCEPDINVVCCDSMVAACYNLMWIKTSIFDLDWCFRERRLLKDGDAEPMKTNFDWLLRNARSKLMSLSIKTSIDNQRCLF